MGVRKGDGVTLLGDLDMDLFSVGIEYYFYKGLTEDRGVYGRPPGPLTKLT
jgi:hypothetical protein